MTRACGVTRVTSSVAIATGLAFCGLSLSQPQSSGREPSRPASSAQLRNGLIDLGQGVTLHAVEAGREDAGRLLRSGRLPRVDLRVPNSFERVYRVDSPTLGAATPPRYARVSGALIAIFPQSEYEMTESGPRSTIPAGTVFAIGREAAARVINPGSGGPQGPEVDRPAAAIRTSQRVDMRANIGAEFPPPTPSTPASASSAASQVGIEFSPPRSGSIWGDEAYRAARVAELLDRAR